MTASKPGRCAGCELDIVPGHYIAWYGDGYYHLECIPAETSQPRRRERIRAGRQ